MSRAEVTGAKFSPNRAIVQLSVLPVVEGLMIRLSIALLRAYGLSEPVGTWCAGNWSPRLVAMKNSLFSIAIDPLFAYHQLVNG
jgi:hypothetical protein